MLFFLCTNEQGRAALHDDYSGEILDVMQSDTWQEARDRALTCDSLDHFEYVVGHGYYPRKAQEQTA